jgi:hypothetical protein
LHSRNSWLSSLFVPAKETKALVVKLPRSGDDAEGGIDKSRSSVAAP